MPTREQYEAAFEIERAHEYPVIDEFERRMGFAVDRERLEAAARVLACPVKKNAPNWQHGRILYALGRSYLASGGNSAWLDIGTAKGFSACAMAWAMAADGATGSILSLDVIRPKSNEPRNSIIDGQVTEGIMSYVTPFLPLEPTTLTVVFAVADEEAGIPDRIGFAFIDGSHTYEGVKSDISIVACRQSAGDIILFDDVNKPQVNKAVQELEGYALEYIRLLPERTYAIAVKQ